MCNVNNLPTDRPEDRIIVFTHDSKQYRTDAFAFASQKIILPDGKLVQVLDWSNSFPPKVIRLEEVPHEFGDKSALQLAAYFNAAIAHPC